MTDVILGEWEVIAGKLLAALDGDDNVAVVVNEDTLNLLIEALDWADLGDVEKERKADQLLAALRMLRKESFR